MGFTMQGAGSVLHWLTLVILCVLPVIAAIVLYKLGSLPGAIAEARGHPQAAAIKVCGWMGIITIVLWPIAMVWAHLAPRDHADRTPAAAAEDMSDLVVSLRQASARVVAIEKQLAAVERSR